MKSTSDELEHQVLRAFGRELSAALLAQRGRLRADSNAAVHLEDSDAFAFALLDFEGHVRALDRNLHTDHGFHFFDGNHLDGIPRAAVEESAVGAFADALLAADAKRGVDLDVAERRMVLVRDPIHAVGHGQYGTHAGDPAQPVQHSVMTASSLGRFFRGVAIPSDFGSILTTAVAMPRIMTQTSVSGHVRPVRAARKV